MPCLPRAVVQDNMAADTVLYFCKRLWGQPWIAPIFALLLHRWLLLRPEAGGAEQRQKHMNVLMLGGWRLPACRWRLSACGWRLSACRRSPPCCGNGLWGWQLDEPRGGAATAGGPGSAPPPPLDLPLACTPTQHSPCDASPSRVQAPA